MECSKCKEEKETVIQLTGCELPFLKGYIEGKFVEGMTWENHGSWHLDHVRPCCSFDLTQEEEKKNVFTIQIYSLCLQKKIYQKEANMKQVLRIRFII